MSNFDNVAKQFQKIQNKACIILESCDGVGKFTNDHWKKNIGQGLSRIIQNGHKIEKGAINFSKVSGSFTPQMIKTLGHKGNTFSATGVSSIFHPKNPFSPIIHMNIRYFEIDSGVCWFGGGIDLTPHYVNVDEAINFHLLLKEVCDKYHVNFYQKFKNQADDYFFIDHREETRGVGGIFFDHVNPSVDMPFEKMLQFCLDLGELYPRIYSKILDKSYSQPYTESNIEWQNLRRSRYVEFNLVYDRGTKFGLESNGNTESILVSMPPTATWAYKYEPVEGSLEEKTMNFLKKGINWLSN